MKKKTHAKFGSPSSLKRLKECPGVLAYTKDMPALPSTTYSVEGDVFHDEMETYLPKALTEKSIKPYVGPKNYPDMAAHVTATAEKVAALWDSFCEKHNNCSVAYEMQVAIDDDTFGTSDVIFTGLSKKTKKTDVIVLDYKYGAGIRVYANENLQGIAYGIGAVKTLKLPFSEIGKLMVIVAQVRVDDEWEKNNYVVAGTELQKWEDEIVTIVSLAKATYEGKVSMRLSAGAHCKFCRADGNCKAQEEEVMNTMQSTLPDEIDDAPIIEKIRAMTLDEQVELFKKKTYIEDILNAVSINLMAALQNGASHKDIKVVRTAGRRGWIKKEERIVSALKKKGVKEKDMYNKKLVGIGEIEKLLGKGNIPKALVQLGTGKQELVSSADPRDAITCSEPDEFVEVS